MTSRLDFLDATSPKTIRTRLYGDQSFTHWELEVMHTPVFQRLYDLKQLGFADRIYPDAEHSRFNHVLGVAQRAEQIAKHLVVALRSQPAASFDVAENGEVQTIKAATLADLVEERIPVVRLVALLHDLTHAAYGHTLEDEVCVFDEKHDEPARQARFFDALTAQLVTIWAMQLELPAPTPEQLDTLRFLEVDSAAVVNSAGAVAGRLEPEALKDHLVPLLQQLEVAQVALLHLTAMHEDDQVKRAALLAALPPLLISDVLGTIGASSERSTFKLSRDAFLLDIVGNTLCADLLDYALRDAATSGLHVRYDDRLLRYVVVVSVSGVLSPTGGPCLRMATQFFTNKMRHDVLSEMSLILKIRYLISERILLHPTKCAAGAMLGTAVQLLGLRALPAWAQVLGDNELRQLLTQAAAGVERVLRHIAEATPAPDPASLLRDVVERLVPIDSRMQAFILLCLGRGTSGAESTVGEVAGREDLPSRMAAARVVLWSLGARRYAKLVYRLRAGIKHSGEESGSVAKRYSNSRARYELERQVEAECGLPLGSVFIHCPRGNTSMKLAHALVVGDDPKRVTYLRTVSEVFRDEKLEPYQDEIQAIERMYASIWCLHAFVASPYVEKRRLIADALRRRLEGFPNDRLLELEWKNEEPTAYDVLDEFRDQVANRDRPEVIGVLDALLAARHRTGGDVRDTVTEAIRTFEADRAREVVERDGLGGTARSRRRRGGLLGEIARAEETEDRSGAESAAPARDREAEEDRSVGGSDSGQGRLPGT